MRKDILDWVLQLEWSIIAAKCLQSAAICRQGDSNDLDA